MPLPPLTDPADPRQRLLAVARVAPAMGFLSGSLLGFNTAQVASVALLPFSPRAFRAFNRWGANTWWGWCVGLARHIHDVRLVVSGDDVPPRENAILVLNHQNMADINFLMDFARSKERLGDMKWVVKDIIKYVPGVGWGMLFLDCVFVKRDWATDKTTVRRTFDRLRRNDVPVWLITFSEGTRITPDKLAKSQEYARRHGLPEPRHVLIPRTKGFVATVEGLRDHVDAVYDLTLGYENGVPTLWQFVQGFAPRAHLHVRRYPVRELPTDDAALSDWLLERFREKDGLLDHYYRHGGFPDTTG